ncbi:type I secretion system permease/ATPase [Luteimonas fraxinea]|uniref:type I secretion system permease/ATPase n=1 Tax=Luteimonas fraxinea TaxID=2901869 RepID=UPI001E3D68A2|nr:type I secretion system permease/ATPase [Luteimonas fraxinea]MCD9124716.1 type I secretion system permease/ATPase [Luteimonas fraxinea]
MTTKNPRDTSEHLPWLDALIAVSRHYRLDGSQERVRVEAEWRARADSLDEVIEHMARQLGLVAVIDRLVPGMLDPWRLPMIVDLGDGQVGVLEQIDSDGNVSVRLSGEHGLVTTLGRDELLQRTQRVLLAKPQSAVPDARVDEYIKPWQSDWLLKEALKEWPRYLDVMLASMVANVLTLAAMLFTMQVYDRVVPAQSVPTLWVLFGGLLIALTFAFLMRVLRTHITDLVGRRADLRISDRVFGHALRIRNDARPRSTGSFVAQLRELEQIRELTTSTTIGALADLPFFVLFLGVIWLIGGHLVLVPLAALPLLLIPGLLAQRPLARLSRSGMRESSIRSAMLVETVQNMDDIKLLRAEPRFQNQWNHLNETTAGIGMRTRRLTGALNAWTQEVQQLVYASVVLVGAFAVMAGELSVGVLVACSMLASRMIAPLGQMTGVMVRWQQAKVAREGLDELMKRPVDQPERSLRVHRPVLRGSYVLNEIRFAYAEAGRPALEIKRLEIAAGEKVALLGRNGAGKSTLLQLLAGMQFPQSGQVLLDEVKSSVLDPMDVRRNVALLNQHAALFYGTLRDNLTMGMPHATDDDLLKALVRSGAADVVRSLPEGLDYMVQEGGHGLSGGQRQTLLLARTLMRGPNVLLLDEPTAWLDEASERRFIDGMEAWLAPRTLVVATHRPAVLKWVDRIVVLEGGRVVRDGPKDDVLARPAVARAPRGASSVVVGKRS